MLKRREKEIELFGTKVKLFERTAGEVQAFAEFVQNRYPAGQVDLTTNYVLTCDVIQDALKPNFKPFLFVTNPIMWWKLKKMMSTKYLIKNLTPLQISDLCKIILEELELNPDVKSGEKKKG